MIIMRHTGARKECASIKIIYINDNARKGTSIIIHFGNARAYLGEVRTAG